MTGPGPFMNGSAMTFVLVNGPAAITLRDWQQRGDVDSARSDHAPSNRRKGSVTAQAAGWTVLPVWGGLPRADLFMALPDPGTPCFYYHPSPTTTTWARTYSKTSRRSTRRSGSRPAWPAPPARWNGVAREHGSNLPSHHTLGAAPRQPLGLVIPIAEPGAVRSDGDGLLDGRHLRGR
jgi:hypothetical protein